MVLVFFLFLAVVPSLVAFPLRREHGSDIRIVWYFFWLSSVITFEVALFALKKHAMTENGTFQGDKGKLLHDALHYLFDINNDFKMLACIVAIIVVPQLLSYMLNGICGCASNPIAIGESFSFLVWSLVKTLATCAGIICALNIFLWTHWASFDWNGAFGLIFTSVGFIFFAFIILIEYHFTEKITDFIQKHCPKLLVNTHSFLTRNSGREDTGSKNI